jgi:hypothetical protein
MRYIWSPGSFVVSVVQDDGSTIEKKFTSSAQARQFAEKGLGITLARKIKHSPSAHLRKKGRNQRMPSVLTPEQEALKARLMQQLKGLV